MKLLRKSKKVFPSFFQKFFRFCGDRIGVEGLSTLWSTMKNYFLKNMKPNIFLGYIFIFIFISVWIVMISNNLKSIFFFTDTVWKFNLYFVSIINLIWYLILLGILVWLVYDINSSIINNKHFVWTWIDSVLNVSCIKTCNKGSLQGGKRSVFLDFGVRIKE